jgi:hypothetical protein
MEEKFGTLAWINYLVADNADLDLVQVGDNTTTHKITLYPQEIRIQCIERFKACKTLDSGGRCTRFAFTPVVQKTLAATFDLFKTFYTTNASSKWYAYLVTCTDAQWCKPKEGAFDILFTPTKVERGTFFARIDWDKNTPESGFLNAVLEAISSLSALQAYLGNIVLQVPHEACLHVGSACPFVSNKAMSIIFGDETYSPGKSSLVYILMPKKPVITYRKGPKTLTLGGLKKTQNKDKTFQQEAAKRAQSAIEYNDMINQWNTWKQSKKGVRKTKFM